MSVARSPSTGTGTKCNQDTGTTRELPPNLIAVRSFNPRFDNPKSTSNPCGTSHVALQHVVPRQQDQPGAQSTSRNVFIRQ